MSSIELQTIDPKIIRHLQEGIRLDADIVLTKSGECLCIRLLDYKCPQVTTVTEEAVQQLRCGECPYAQQDHDNIRRIFSDMKQISTLNTNYARGTILASRRHSMGILHVNGRVRGFTKKRYLNMQ